MAATEIQVRSVPEGVEKELERRASQEGLSLSQYVLRLIELDLAMPSKRDFAALLAQHEPVDLGISAAQLLEEARREL